MASTKQYNKEYYNKNKDYFRKYKLNNHIKINSYSKEYRVEYYKRNRYESVFRYKAYKSTAKTKGLEFNLTKNEFEQFVKMECHYCTDKAFGIDRLNSSLGYIKGNMVPCCRICNQMKNDRSVEDFINKCKEIVLKNYE